MINPKKSPGKDVQYIVIYELEYEVGLGVNRSGLYWVMGHIQEKRIGHKYHKYLMLQNKFLKWLWLFFRFSASVFLPDSKSLTKISFKTLQNILRTKNYE